MNKNSEQYKIEANRYYNVARKILKEDGEFYPILVMITESSVYVLPMQMPDEKAKSEFLMLMKVIAKRLKAKAVITIAETWYVDAREGDEGVNLKGENSTDIIGCMPSEHENRKEALSVICSIKGCPSVQIKGNMTRYSSGKIAEVTRDLDWEKAPVNIEGRMSNMCGDDLPDDIAIMDLSLQEVEHLMSYLCDLSSGAGSERLKGYKKSFKKAMH